MPCCHLGLIINGEEVEKVTSFKSLGVCIEEDLAWSLNISHPKKKPNKDFSEDKTAGILASLLHTGRTCKRVVKTAQWIIRSPLSKLEDIPQTHLQKHAKSIFRSWIVQSHLMTIYTSHQISCWYNNLEERRR